MASYLRRPQQQQRFYGAPPAPFAGSAGGVVGATMAPPMARGGGAGAAAAVPFMPTPAPQVTTNPSLTPFQISVNNQRATESRRAATFARNAPLPMSPVPTPSPISAQPAIMPMGQQPAPMLQTPAPMMQYSGAHGVGPQAEQTAQAARAAFISTHEDTANAQDRGPGLGVNSYANAQFRQDANQRANDAADNPNAKDQYYEAGAAERLARANSLIPAQADRATEQGKNLATKTEGEKQLQPGRVEQQGVKTTAIKQTGDAAQSRALTAAQAQQDKVLLERLRTSEQALRSNVRLSESAKLAIMHERIKDLNSRRMIAINAGIRTDDKGGINDQIVEVMKQMQPAAATQPAAQGGQGAEPGASAAPAGGEQLVGHDPAARTPEAIAMTAKNRGISEDEVLRRLGVA